MKKLTAMFMVLCLSVIAVGCGGEEGRTPPTAPATSGDGAATSGDGAASTAH